MGGTGGGTGGGGTGGGTGKEFSYPLTTEQQAMCHGLCSRSVD